MHDQVKKEVISQLLGEHLGSHVQGDSLYFFKPDYYEKTPDPEKKDLIKKCYWKFYRLNLYFLKRDSAPLLPMLQRTLE